MGDDLHDAAFRAGVWQVIEQRAKELKDQAKAELSALTVGDTVAGRYRGQVIAKATMTSGRAKLAVTDEHAFTAWVKANHPSEIVEAVNPAYVKALERTVVDGVVIDDQGEIVPGVEWVQGDPFVSVRRDKDAATVVAQLFTSGQLSLDGIKPVDRWTEDTEAGAIG